MTDRMTLALIVADDLALWRSNSGDYSDISDLDSGDSVYVDNVLLILGALVEQDDQSALWYDGGQDDAYVLISGGRAALVTDADLARGVEARRRGGRPRVGDRRINVRVPAWVDDLAADRRETISQTVRAALEMLRDS